MHKLSLILCTKDEGEFIEGFFKNINAQTLRPSMQIICVDSSSDNTSEVCKKNADVFVSKPINLPEARNLGAQYADAPYLYFTDADIRLPFNTALEEALNYVRSRNIKIATALVEQPQGHFLGELRECFRSVAPSLTGQIILIDKQVFHDIGGFPKLYLGEDSSLGVKAWLSGYGIHLLPFNVRHLRPHNLVLKKADLGRNGVKVCRNQLGAQCASLP
jgi:glycosyltransferase involved in cell wall biosynthesis